MNFVALAIIADIDNIFAACSKDQAIEHVRGEDEWTPKIAVPALKFKERKRWNRCLYCPYWTVKLLHVIGYFYYFAFMCMILNYLPTSKNCEYLEENPCDKVTY